MWGKLATSPECKTIRIAESSVMDSWKALLRPMCKVLRFEKKMEMFYATMPKGRHEVVGKKRKTMKGFGREGGALRKDMF